MQACWYSTACSDGFTFTSACNEVLVPFPDSFRRTSASQELLQQNADKLLKSSILSDQPKRHKPTATGCDKQALSQCLPAQQVKHWEMHVVQFHHMGAWHSPSATLATSSYCSAWSKTVRFIIIGLLFPGWRKFNKPYSKSKQTCCMFFRFAFQSQTLGLQNWHLLFPV